ncbi:hypothetical protein AAFF_G00289360 [Aldrovandia affinis]|uniref:Uncharacterized protein n=1 Tax=Aldrovandia affinis TaxID=143900 RepID=A0AAD7W0Z4_9TELE|nr:hypothetical protein AAFF_G00289360 [Aldrovandia affinis]
MSRRSRAPAHGMRLSVHAVGPLAHARARCHRDRVSGRALPQRSKPSADISLDINRGSLMAESTLLAL